MSVAIVTDAVSANNYFPLWHAYYSRQFSPQSIFVFTYLENEQEFRNFELGGLTALPQSYNDDLRRDVITRFVGQLLNVHSVVIRVDIDEFLVPEPSRFLSLSSYVNNVEVPYITAHGFDIIQSPSEPSLDLSKGLLSQRRYAYALTAMNKTCITRAPLKWGRGFHYCSSPPQFGELYLFHTKRADIKMQADWNNRMLAKAGADPFVSKYYSWAEKNITEYHTNRLALPIVEGDDCMIRSEFDAAFLQKIQKNEKDDIYEGPYDIEQVNVIIPDRFRTYF